MVTTLDKQGKETSREAQVELRTEWQEEASFVNMGEERVADIQDTCALKLSLGERHLEGKEWERQMAYKKLE